MEGKYWGFFRSTAPLKQNKSYLLTNLSSDSMESSMTEWRLKSKQSGVVVEIQEKNNQMRDSSQARDYVNVNEYGGKERQVDRMMDMHKEVHQYRWKSIIRGYNESEKSKDR